MSTFIYCGGKKIDIGTDVITWKDKGGFNGYTTEKVIFEEEDRKTGKIKKKIIKGKRYGRRRKGLDGIKQIVIHHSGGDGSNPRNMYNTLYNRRGLSCHFAVEDDGRIYQFNDIIDRCFHAGKHNKISVGIECCLYPLANKKPDFYSKKRNKRNGNLPHGTMIDNIHGRPIKVFKFTHPQIEALVKLCAGIWYGAGHLATIPAFYRDNNHQIPRTVIDNPLEHVGLIGHLQCTKNKIDPAGFPWEEFERKLIDYYYENM